MGDRVDVVSEKLCAVLVADVEVLAIDAGVSGGGLGGSAGNKFVTTVAVEPQEAAIISYLNDSGKLDIIRSTGATPIDTLPVTCPGGLAPMASLTPVTEAPAQ